MTNFEYKKQIQRCISQLDETYLDVFKKVEHLLRVDISSKKKRLKILLYFSEFLATHMLNNHSLDTMFPNGIDKFYSDLITNTNLNGVEKQKKIVYGIVTL